VIPQGSSPFPWAKPPRWFWPRAKPPRVWQSNKPGCHNPSFLFSPCRPFPTSHLLAAAPHPFPSSQVIASTTLLLVYSTTCAATPRHRPGDVSLFVIVQAKHRTTYSTAPPSPSSSALRYLIISPSTTVGDSPRGPLKRWGKTHLKPRTKPNNVKPNHAGHGPQGLRRPIEAAHAGIPSKRTPPRSRLHAPFGRVSPRSRGSTSLEQVSPRSRVRPALGWGPPRSRASRTRAPAPYTGI
jgi:hypothetical protein